METKEFINKLQITPAARFHLQMDGAEVELPSVSDGSSITLLHCCAYPLHRDESGSVEFFSQLPSDERIELLLDDRPLYTVKPRTSEPYAFLQGRDGDDAPFVLRLESQTAVLVPATETAQA